METPQPVEKPQITRDFVNVRVRNQRLFSKIGFDAFPFDLSVGKLSYGTNIDKKKSLYVKDSAINRVANDVSQLDQIVAEVDRGSQVFFNLEQGERDGLFTEYSHWSSLGSHTDWTPKIPQSVKGDDIKTLERFLEQRWFEDMYKIGKKQTELTNIVDVTKPKKADWKTVVEEGCCYAGFDSGDKAVKVSGKPKEPKTFKIASLVISVPGGKYPYFITEDQAPDLDRDELKKRILDLDESTDKCLALEGKDNNKFSTYYDAYKMGRLSDRAEIRVPGFSQYEPFFNQRFLKEMVSPKETAK